ncbi:2-oxoglutarate and iron-dependent oxygenase domain-containing protein [Pycnococcus provasolii]
MSEAVVSLRVPLAGGFDKTADGASLDVSHDFRPEDPSCRFGTVVVTWLQGTHEPKSSCVPWPSPVDLNACKARIRKASKLEREENACEWVCVVEAPKRLELVHREEEEPPPSGGEDVWREHATALYHASGGDALRDADTGNVTRELERWRDAFVDVAMKALAENTKQSIHAALGDQDGADDTSANEPDLLVRKKDAPRPGDDAASAAMRKAQAVQGALVAKRSTASRQALTVAGHEHLDAPLTWRAPPHTARDNGGGGGDDNDDDARSAPALYRDVYAHRAKHARRRVVADGALSPKLCRTLAGVAVVALHSANATSRGGEAHVRVDDPSALSSLFIGEAGHEAASAVRGALSAVTSAAERHFDEPAGRLRIAGALLTRLEIPPADAAYDYTQRHIDKANVRSYDYSCLVYLNDASEEDGAATRHPGQFAGGNFRFVDASMDEVVVPRQGRFVCFTSGADNLHAVDAVLSGHRFVLAVWLTLQDDDADADNGSEVTSSTPAAADESAPDLSHLRHEVDAKIAAMVKELGLSPEQVRALEAAAVQRGVGGGR